MNTPDKTTEDISRIQDKLAEIVTKDLIAGKVTSVRDAPRIVSIGRVIVDLDHVAGAVFELEVIVADLAEHDPVSDVLREDAPPSSQRDRSSVHPVRSPGSESGRPFRFVPLAPGSRMGPDPGVSKRMSSVPQPVKR